MKVYGGLCLCPFLLRVWFWFRGTVGEGRVLEGRVLGKVVDEVDEVVNGIVGGVVDRDKDGDMDWG